MHLSVLQPQMSIFKAFSLTSGSKLQSELVLEKNSDSHHCHRTGGKIHTFHSDKANQIHIC